MAKKIKAKLQTLANPERAVVSQSFFKTGKGEYGEGDVFIGVPMPQLRTVANMYTDISLGEVEALLHSKIHEHRTVALLILCNQYKKGTEAQKKKIYQLYTRSISCCINNWDLVDVSAYHIVGPYLARKSRKPLYVLAKSKNIWEKRVSIVSTWCYIRQKDLDDTFTLAEMLLYDDHDLIHKAVGWMLREAGKKDIRRLKLFLDMHKNTMPRTMLRYAIEKLSEKERKNYLQKQGQ